MSSLMAVVPSVRGGETLLLGSVSNGFPFAIRYAVGLNAATLLATPMGPLDMEREIEQALGSQFESADTAMDIDQITSDPAPPVTFHARLSATLAIADAVGWERVNWFGSDGSSIEFFVMDDRYRKHAIKFTVIDSDASMMKCDVALPAQYIEENAAIADAPSIFERFAAKVSDYQLFWNDLSELDQQATILEPANPGFSDVHRTIYLESHVSLHLVFEPATPRMMPEMLLRGPETRTRIYQSSIDERMGTWDDEYSLLENLTRIFGQFRTPGQLSQLSLQREYPNENDEKRNEDEPALCEVCYDGDEPPDERCKRCQRHYHGACLKQCLKRQPAKRATFNNTVCCCPHCGSTTSTKVTKR